MMAAPRRMNGQAAPRERLHEPPLAKLMGQLGEGGKARRRQFVEW